MTLTVADVSHWQFTIDWNKFAPTIDAVVIKAGGGDGVRSSDKAHVLLYRDSQFRRNRDEARRLGVPRWYYFFVGCAHTPEQEADHFLSLLPDVRDDEGLVLDYEVLPPHVPADPGGWCASFIERVEQLTGKTCAFYTNENRVLTIDWAPVVGTGAPLWVAKYGRNDGQPHERPRTGPWPSALMWQFTSQRKHTPGIPSENLDMNQFFGDVARFKAQGSGAMDGARSGFDLSADQLRRIVHEELVGVFDSKAKRVQGITSWERYLEVLLDAARG